MTILVSNNQHDHSVCVNCGERIFKRDARSPILELYICDNWSHQLYTWPFSLCYFAEKDIPDTGYTSIPEAMWWAIQTLTSVRQIKFNLLEYPVPAPTAIATPRQKNVTWQYLGNQAWYPRLLVWIYSFKNFWTAHKSHLMIFRLGMETWVQAVCLGNWWDLEMCMTFFLRKTTWRRFPNKNYPPP